MHFLPFYLQSVRKKVDVFHYEWTEYKQMTNNIYNNIEQHRFLTHIK